MKNTKKIILALIIVVIVSISLKKTIVNYYEKKKLFTNSKIIDGVITKYYEIGIANYYLDYRYCVDGIFYEKEVIPSKLFKKCEKNNWCINKKIYVRYYVDNPSISEPILDSTANSDDADISTQR
ncbi:hypothetical protein [Flavobacterium sp. KACC 22763]|uniref:hypothetical protein n=1 Tax=Flavobacterium sp. KACC 22763 TaxID=3025668 RepID=UPI0023655066|nr:hypothetical protein [Flavobacterium sp. KACC 22763]WDF66489.1 hypothetical protein PQ463_10030 [Flavobacterium sp. KACC 22763]